MITGRRTGYYWKWKEGETRGELAEGRTGVGSRLLAEDEFAELGERTGNVEGIPRWVAMSDPAGGRKSEGNGMRGKV